MASVQTLQDINGVAVYPNTIASAVVVRDGAATLDGMLSDGVYLGKDVMNAKDIDPIDATTLGGHNSDYFAKSEDLTLLSSQYAETIQEHQTQITNLGNRIKDVQQSLTEDYVEIQGNAGFHNSIYRGKDITSYLTDGSLFTRISSGTFDDLFIGDYFYMNNLAVDGYTVVTKKFVLCGFDTYLQTGDSALTRHHAVVMPSGRLFTAAMNATNTTEGGYYNTVMHQTIMPKIAAGIKAVIGDSHLITYRDLLTKTTNNGASSDWAWYDTTCRVCSEVDVYGSAVWGNGYDVGLGNRQLPIFRLYTRFYQGEDRWWMWLSTVTSATHFAACNYLGDSAGWAGASASGGGVRPRFLIG